MSTDRHSTVVEQSDSLRHCDGFRVLSGGRRVGVVEEVMTIEGRPRALVVAAGVLRLRTLLVPADAVESVQPASRCVVLRSARRSTPSAMQRARRVVLGRRA